MDAAALYTDALDVGDRLADALAAGDLEGASRALAERQRVLDALAATAPPRPSPALVDRFRRQDARIQGVLGDQLAGAREALGAVERTASAHGRYHAVRASTGHRLDTARRGP